MGLRVGIACIALAGCGRIGFGGAIGDAGPDAPVAPTGLRMSLTVSPPLASLVDVPVLLTLDRARLGGYSLGGYSVLDQDMSVLDTEREVDANGTARIWVRVPTLTQAMPHTLTLVTSPAVGDNHQVWSEYDSVWHLDDLHDSAGSFDGVAAGPTPSTGIVGGGQHMGGGADDLIFGQDTDLRPSIAVSVEAWINLDVEESLQDDYAGFVTKWSGQQGGYTLMFSQPAANGLVFSTADGNQQDAVYPTRTIETAGWHYVVGTWHAASGQKALYLDGEPLLTMSSSNTTIAYQAGDSVHVGKNGGAGGVAMRGTIDEVRISSTSFGTAWVKLQYLSITDNLLAYGPLQ